VQLRPQKSKTGSGRKKGESDLKSRKGRAREKEKQRGGAREKKNCKSGECLLEFPPDAGILKKLRRAIHTPTKGK
jgi:hypothetical protein